MSTDLLPYITGSGGALVVMAIGLWLFLKGKVHSDSEFRKLETAYEQLRAENNQYRIALETERKTLNDAASAGQVTNQLIAALTAVATGKRTRPEGITPKDLGL